MHTGAVAFSQLREGLAVLPSEIDYPWPSLSSAGSWGRGQSLKPKQGSSLSDLGGDSVQSEPFSRHNSITAFRVHVYQVPTRLSSMDFCHTCFLQDAVALRPQHFLALSFRPRLSEFVVASLGQLLAGQCTMAQNKLGLPYRYAYLFPFTLRANALEEQLKEQELRAQERVLEETRKQKELLCKMEREKSIEIENLQAR